MDKKTKYCKRCDTTYDISNFTKASSRYDGVQAYCQDCMKLYRIEHYQGNKDQYDVRRKKSRAELRQIVVDRKQEPCADCGIVILDEPWLFELDHRDPSLKSNSIDYFIKNGSKDKLLQELDKCDNLCLFCHRRRTAKLFNWTINKYLNK